MGLFDLGDAATGGLISGGLGLVGGLLTNQANADRADQSNAWSAQQFATRYQTTVKDLEAAGLNPMLAYSQGGGSPPTAQQVQFQNPVSSAFDAVRGQSSATQSYSSASQADSVAKQADANTEKILAEIPNVSDQGKVLRQTAQMLSQQSTLMAQQGATQQEQQAVLRQTVLNLKKDGVLKDLDIDAANSLGNIGRESRQLKPVVDILRAILVK